MIAYTKNSYGLRERDMKFMFKTFISIPAIEKVILFGSRATGKFELASDVDLAILGSKVTFSEIARIHYLFENESPTLLWFDVLHYDTLKNQELKERIDKFGIAIYQKN